MSDRNKSKAINVYKGKIVLEKVARGLNLLEFFQALETMQ